MGDMNFSHSAREVCVSGAIAMHGYYELICIVIKEGMKILPAALSVDPIFDVQSTGNDSVYGAERTVLCLLLSKILLGVYSRGEDLRAFSTDGSSLNAVERHILEFFFRIFHSLRKKFYFP